MDIKGIKKQVKEQISAVDFTDFCSKYENNLIEDGEYVFILNGIGTAALFNVDVSYDEKTDDAPSRLWFDIYGPFDDSEDPKNCPIHSSKGWTDTGVYLSYDEFIDKVVGTICEMIEEIYDTIPKKVSVTFTAKFDIDERDLEKMKRLEHHVEALLDLEMWPEIKSVYDVHVNAEN